MSDADPVLYEVDDNHVGTITLNRPEAMNSLTYQSYMDLEDIVRTSEARALVLTATGRAFARVTTLSRFSGTRHRHRKSSLRGPSTREGSRLPQMRCCIPTFQSSPR